MGPQRDDPPSLAGDPLLFRRNGLFAYHLAVVDDGFQGIMEIVRGISIDEIIGWLGCSLGCLDRAEPCATRELVPHFHWSKVPLQKVTVPGTYA